MWLSILLFLTAGLLEIGGGALVWRWWREGAPWWLGWTGFAALAAYGIVPTYQAPHFSRVYAAYGGVFIILSLLWGWGVDGVLLDRYDAAGALLCVAGVGLIMYAPR